MVIISQSNQGTFHYIVVIIMIIFIIFNIGIILETAMTIW